MRPLSLFVSKNKTYFIFTATITTTKSKISTQQRPETCQLCPQSFRNKFIAKIPEYEKSIEDVQALSSLYPFNHGGVNYSELMEKYIRTKDRKAFEILKEHEVPGVDVKIYKDEINQIYSARIQPNAIDYNKNTVDICHYCLFETLLNTYFSDHDHQLYLLISSLRLSKRPPNDPTTTKLTTTTGDKNFQFSQM